MQMTLTQRVRWLVFWFILIGSFVTIGFLLVATATGYRYNASVGRWQKTGMLIVSISPNNSTLRLDGQSYFVERSMIRVPNVLPGTYRVQIDHHTYTPWMQTITIKPGYVVNLDPVSLFLEDPIESPGSVAQQELIATATPSREVRIVDGELRHGTSLVSRFVDPPSSAILLPTGRHVLYVQGKELRIIQTNGLNDHLIYTRDNNNPTLLVMDDESTVIFYDGDLVKALKIR